MRKRPLKCECSGGGVENARGMKPLPSISTKEQGDCVWDLRNFLVGGRLASDLYKDVCPQAASAL